jgi:hypothetical protein
MATSRSPDAWTACADVFSGRPNPTWEVPAPLARELASAFLRLPRAAPDVGAPSVGATTTPGVGARPASGSPALGYRGCALRSPDGELWRAGAGVVSSSLGGREGEARSDAGRAWERRLLASAPDGVLPSGWAR